nr:ATP-binding protein [Devriesea agamarum]
MPTVYLILALLAGLVVGAVSVASFVWSEHRRRPQESEHLPAVPEPAAEVLQVLRSAYVVLDASGDVVRASPLSYSYGLVRARSGEYPRLATPELMTLVSQVGRDGGFRDQRMHLRRSNHEDGEAVMDVRVGALGADQVLMLADDVTRAVRVEKTRRDFVANVSHELKTPVGALTLLAETMEDAAEDPQAVRRFAERMQTESRRLSKLVQEIIELSRVQGASALPDASPVEIDEVVDAAVGANRTIASASDIEMTVGGTPGLCGFGSHDMLVTALSNLVSNAVAYSPPHTHIGVSTRSVSGMIEIVVKDEGIGISPENLNRVFERFFRVDKARSRQTGGTGLGLAIVKHIASDHGGEVVAWSQEGNGSTFTLRLPEMGQTDSMSPTSSSETSAHLDSPENPPASGRVRA